MSAIIVFTLHAASRLSDSKDTSPRESAVVTGQRHQLGQRRRRRRGTVLSVDSEALARRFHETYERLAPAFGYTTRSETAVPWEQIPGQNRYLMIAVCEELVKELCGSTVRPHGLASR
jgi:hypothetical protein